MSLQPDLFQSLVMLLGGTSPFVLYLENSCCSPPKLVELRSGLQLASKKELASIIRLMRVEAPKHRDQFPKLAFRLTFWPPIATNRA
ncbi:hypothetical protein BASA81_001083 [Batrachochytrium salamandrivorans]|nr:hypothetical protein BASA81_001083 [Batrachochytrium salamandrivorans]